MMVGGGALPYDAEVEYLQSDSTAYIDTGISGGNNYLSVYVKFSISSHINYAPIYGNYIDDSHNYTRLITSTSSGTGITSVNRKGNTSINISLNNIHEVVTSQSVVVVDAVSKSTTTGSGTANSNNIVLFNRSTSPVTRDVGLKVYAFKVWDSGTLVLDFIPVRVGSVGYMYDKVSGELFGSTGSGNFVVGSDKVIGALQAVMFDGQQYVDFGYSPNPSTKIVADIEFMPNGNALIGSSNNLWLGVKDNTIGAFYSNFGSNNDQYDYILYWFEKGYVSRSWYKDYGGVVCSRSIWTYENNSVTFQGSTISTETKTTTQDGTLALGGATNHFNRHNLIVWSFDIYDNGVLVKSFRPMASSGHVGLYDSINDTFIYSGTGKELIAIYN